MARQACQNPELTLAVVLALAQALTLALPLELALELLLALGSSGWVNIGMFQLTVPMVFRDFIWMDLLNFITHRLHMLWGVALWSSLTSVPARRVHLFASLEPF
jgi:hypothetical protein